MKGSALLMKRVGPLGKLRLAEGTKTIDCFGQKSRLFSSKESALCFRRYERFGVYTNKIVNLFV